MASDRRWRAAVDAKWSVSYSHARSAHVWAAGLLTLSSSLALAALLVRPTILCLLVYAVLITALIYTHYSGFFAIAAQALVLGVYGLDRIVRNRNAWIWAAGLAVVVVVTLAYIPWWSTFRATSGAGGPGYLPDLNLKLVSDTSRSMLGLEEAKGAWLVLALPVLLLGAYSAVRRWREPDVAAVAVIALVPVGQILVSIVFEPVFDLRQTRPYIPGLAFVYALGFVEAVAFCRRQVRLAPAAWALLVLIGIATVTIAAIGTEQTYEAPSRHDWKGVAQEVKGLPVLIAPGYQAQTLAYYRGNYFDVTPLWTANMAKVREGNVPMPKGKASSGFVLVLQGPGLDLLPVFQTHFDVDAPTTYPGGVNTYRVRAKPSPQLTAQCTDLSSQFSLCLSD